MYIASRGYEIVPEKGGQFQDPTPRRKAVTGKSKLASEVELDTWAARDFIDNVKARKRPNADVEEGHRSTTMAHIANIALAVRATLQWDAQAERFTNNEAANALLSYEYRSPWKLG
jgi:hypothetical protein